MRQSIYFSLLFAFFAQLSFAQIKTDSSIVVSKKDSTVIASKTDSVVKKHSPTKATLLSLALPGAGQYYNKKYWKIPIIYAGLVGMGYLAHYNNDFYQQYKSAYEMRIDEDSNTVDQYEGIYSEDDLLTLKNFYRRNRDLSYIVGGLIYVLNILDADVDAHLFYFDVTDDISLNVQPSFNFNAQNKPVSGLNLKFNF